MGNLRHYVSDLAYGHDKMPDRKDLLAGAGSSCIHGPEAENKDAVAQLMFSSLFSPRPQAIV